MPEIEALLKRYDASTGDWRAYAHFDAHKYTRNLIATNDTFTLLLLCWNKGHESPIHDHPCDGCWVRVVHGGIREVQYAKDPATGSLAETKRVEASAGDVTFINDSIALHKVGTLDADHAAVTLHLYAPPFSQCRVWLDPDNADKVLTPTITHFSEYGRRVDHR